MPLAQAKNIARPALEIVHGSPIYHGSYQDQTTVFFFKYFLSYSTEQ